MSEKPINEPGSFEDSDNPRDLGISPEQQAEILRRLDSALGGSSPEEEEAPEDPKIEFDAVAGGLADDDINVIPSNVPDEVPDGFAGDALAALEVMFPTPDSEVDEDS